MAATRGPGEEERILQQARGNPAAFAPIYERYFTRVYGYCFCRVSRAAEAEELTGRIFTRALADLPTYRRGSAAVWLFRIAHLAVAGYLRDRGPAGPDTAATVGTPAATAGADWAVRSEEMARMARLIVALPAPEQDLLALKIAGELSTPQVGAVLGMSEAAIRAWLHRTVRRLRRAYIQAEQE